MSPVCGIFSGFRCFSGNVTIGFHELPLLFFIGASDISRVLQRFFIGGIGGFQEVFRDCSREFSGVIRL